MESVFVVQHLHVLSDGTDDVKFVGVYRTRGTAQAAVERLNGLPGFCDHPDLVDPTSCNDRNGFYIDEYQVDIDHWTEGYVTI